MRWLGLLLLLCFPWLNSYVDGPTPNVWPWLVSAMCAALVWWMRAKLGPPVIATAWLVAAVASALIGFCQYLGLAHHFVFMHVSDVGEAFANLRQRNQFATLVSIGFLTLLWHASHDWGGSKKNTDDTFSTLLPGYILIVPLAVGNAASGSRTGLLQWLLVVVLTFLWRSRGSWRLVGLSVSALAMYLVAVLALPMLLDWFTGQVSGGLVSRITGQDGCSSRLTLWTNVLHLIAQKPWLGWGWGELDYAHFTTLYPGDRFCEILDNAHNLPLHLAVELGVPVSVVICGGGLWLVWRARPWREPDPTRQLAWGVLAVIMLHSMLEYPLWYGPFQMAFVLCIWLLWRSNAQASLATADAPMALSNNAWFASDWMGKAIATVVMGAVAYAAWDYHRISQIYLAPQERSPAYRDHALEKAQASWLFRDQVRFAELTTTELTPGNAAHINALAKEVLHFSPESRVVAKVIESAIMLGYENEVKFFSQRFQTAYPQEYAHWTKRVDSSEAE